MPHIIVEYSQYLDTQDNLQKILTVAHEALAAEGIDKVRIKTRAIELHHTIVGNAEYNKGNMVHMTLLLLEGRDIPLKQRYGKAIYDSVKPLALAQFPDCSVTLEVRDMTAQTYIQA